MAAPKDAREYLARIGRKGGQARAKNMTAAARKASARKAIAARWAKARPKVAKPT